VAERMPDQVSIFGLSLFVLVQVAHRTAARRGYVELRSAPVFVWVDGMLAQVTLYTDIDEARAVAERLAEE
jgi:hypothetical protein